MRHLPTFAILLALAGMIVLLACSEAQEHHRQVDDVRKGICPAGWYLWSDVLGEGCVRPEVPQAASWNCGRTIHPLPCPVTEPII